MKNSCKTKRGCDATESDNVLATDKLPCVVRAIHPGTGGNIRAVRAIPERRLDAKLAA